MISANFKVRFDQGGDILQANTPNNYGKCIAAIENPKNN